MQEDLFGICPYVTAQKLLTGKWTLLIMHHLSTKSMRFNELHRALPHLTQATLTKQLRMMEENGLIVRARY
jgi:DNA-binding HxlR family transcriptional regulator